jgi:hypothetical protein
MLRKRKRKSEEKGEKEKEKIGSKEEYSQIGIQRYF